MADEGGAVVVEESNAHVYMEGLSRVDRVVDDSGYAFTALDVVVRLLASTHASLASSTHHH